MQERTSAARARPNQRSISQDSRRLSVMNVWHFFKSHTLFFLFSNDDEKKRIRLGRNAFRLAAHLRKKTSLDDAVRYKPNGL